MSAKFPKMLHVPWSPGTTNDDKIMSDSDFGKGFIGRAVVVTEKLDGSNVCMTYDDVYARSHFGSPPHSSFSMAKALHGSVRHKIPKGMSIFGEYCFAVHSIVYSDLPSVFHVFAIREDATGYWLGWSDTQAWANGLGFPTVPATAVMSFINIEHAKERLVRFTEGNSKYGDTREGFVVRRSCGFEDVDFNASMAKWVRPDHVQTDVHWKKNWTKQPL